MILSRTILLAVVFLLAQGCAPVLKGPIGPEGLEAPTDSLDHGYSILMSLLEDEAKVDQLLAIKSASKETSEIITDISNTAISGMAEIRAMATKAPVINLEATGFPIIEVDSRNRIANQQTATLLLAGKTFELKVLLTQDKAMGYAAALCESLSIADGNSYRSKEMRALGDRFTALNASVLARLITMTADK